MRSPRSSPVPIPARRLQLTSMRPCGPQASSRSSREKEASSYDHGHQQGDFGCDVHSVIESATAPTHTSRVRDRKPADRERRGAHPRRSVGIRRGRNHRREPATCRCGTSAGMGLPSHHAAPGRHSLARRRHRAGGRSPADRARGIQVITPVECSAIALPGAITWRRAERWCSSAFCSGFLKTGRLMAHVTRMDVRSADIDANGESTTGSSTFADASCSTTRGPT
jgi:hypothetical protein